MSINITPQEDEPWRSQGRQDEAAPSDMQILSVIAAEFGVTNDLAAAWVLEMNHQALKNIAA